MIISQEPSLATKLPIFNQMIAANFFTSLLDMCCFLSQKPGLNFYLSKKTKKSAHNNQYHGIHKTQPEDLKIDCNFITQKLLKIAKNFNASKVFDKMIATKFELSFIDGSLYEGMSRSSCDSSISEAKVFINDKLIDLYHCLLTTSSCLNHIGIQKRLLHTLVFTHCVRRSYNIKYDTIAHLWSNVESKISLDKNKVLYFWLTNSLFDTSWLEINTASMAKTVCEQQLDKINLCLDLVFEHCRKEGIREEDFMRQGADLVFNSSQTNANIYCQFLIDCQRFDLYGNIRHKNLFFQFLRIYQDQLVSKTRLKIDEHTLQCMQSLKCLCELELLSNKTPINQIKQTLQKEVHKI